MRLGSLAALMNLRGAIHTIPAGWEVSADREGVPVIVRAQRLRCERDLQNILW